MSHVQNQIPVETDQLFTALREASDDQVIVSRVLSGAERVLSHPVMLQVEKKGIISVAALDAKKHPQVTPLENKFLTSAGPSVAVDSIEKAAIYIGPLAASDRFSQVYELKAPADGIAILPIRVKGTAVRLLCGGYETRSEPLNWVFLVRMAEAASIGLHHSVLKVVHQQWDAFMGGAGSGKVPSSHDDAASYNDLDLAIVEMVSHRELLIPPYPAVATQLTALLNRGEHNVADIVKLIEMDQALTADVLRYANSAILAAGERVTSLHKAISRIGTRKLTNLALISSLAGHSAQKGPLVELRSLVWRRALSCAAVCQALALVRGLDESEAFVCGLLHDFGSLMALMAIEGLLRQHQKKTPTSQQFWTRLVDRFHIPLGLLVADKWKFTPLLLEVMATHHQPQASRSFKKVVDMVQVSDRIVEMTESRSAVTDEDLTAVGSLLTAEERKRIVELVPLIPEILESFGEMGAQNHPDRPVKVTGKETTIPSLVAKPATTLQGARRDVDLGAVTIHRDREESQRVKYIAGDGLGISGAQIFRENDLVQLRIEVTPEPLQFYATVNLCVPEDGGYRLEVKPFGLTSEGKRRWLELSRA